MATQFCTELYPYPYRHPHPLLQAVEEMLLNVDPVDSDSIKRWGLWR